MQMFFPSGSGNYEARELGAMIAIDEIGEPLADGVGDGPREAARILRREDADGRPLAVLLADPSQVLVNGQCPWPLVVLRRGDEIRVGVQSWFFTDESPLRVRAYEPGGGAAETCLRCHAPLQPGEPIVRCPGCGSPYMAQPDRDPSCWTFGPCLVCGREPRVAFSWTPGPLTEPQPVRPAEADREATT